MERSIRIQKGRRFCIENYDFECANCAVSFVGLFLAAGAVLGDAVAARMAPAAAAAVVVPGMVSYFFGMVSYFLGVVQTPNYRICDGNGDDR